MEFCKCSMFCFALLSVHSSFAFISMGKRELIALLCLSSWCLVIVVWRFLTMPRVCLQFVIVVFPAHTQLLFLLSIISTGFGQLVKMLRTVEPHGIFRSNFAYFLNIVQQLQYKMAAKLCRASFWPVNVFIENAHNF